MSFDIVEFIPKKKKDRIEIEGLRKESEDKKNPVNEDERLPIRNAQRDKEIAQVAWKKAVVRVLNGFRFALFELIFAEEAGQA